MTAHEAILGWILRDYMREEGTKAVLEGVSTHAYLVARGDGASKEDAQATARIAKAEAKRLTGRKALAR